MNPSRVNIRELRVRAVKVPMVQPHRSACGIIAESPLVLTYVLTEDGIVGHSMVFTYTVAALKPTAELIKNLESLIVGEPFAPAEIAQRLLRQFRLLGPQGLVAITLAAMIWHCGMRWPEATPFPWFAFWAESRNPSLPGPQSNA